MDSTHCIGFERRSERKCLGAADPVVNETPVVAMLADSCECWKFPNEMQSRAHLKE